MSAMPEYKSTITDEVNVSPSAQEKLIELLDAEEEVNGVRIFGIEQLDQLFLS